jgi:hypothetical protein
MVVRLLSDERGWNSLILVGGVHPRQGDDAFDYDGLLVGVSDSAPQSSANVETGDSRELLGLPFDPGYPFAPTYGLEALGHYLGLDRQGLMVGDVVSQEVNSLPQWQQTGIEYTIEAAKIVDDVTTGGAWTAAITSAQANSHDADVKCAEAVAMTILLVWDGPAALVGRVVKVGGTVIVKMAEVYSRVPKTIVKQIAEGLARALSLGVRQGKEFLQGWVQRCILAREAQRAAAKDALDAAGKIALEEAEYAAEKKAAEAAAANCFAAGTVIQMANGTTKPIEHVRVGDLVWSRNEGIGRTEACKVGRTSVRHVKSALYLAFANAATGATDHVVTTSEHPFYVKAKGFVRAGSLGNGTQIVTRAGPPASVSATETRNDRDGYTVYNLTVESDHTFFVGKLAGGVWVHNCTVDPNKLIHIFDNAGHHLSPVVQFFGSQKVAFVAIQTAFSKVAGRYTAEQLLVGIPVKVGPFMITIRGVFVEGVPRVSTAFIPPIP